MERQERGPYFLFREFEKEKLFFFFYFSCNVSNQISNSTTKERRQLDSRKTREQFNICRILIMKRDMHHVHQFMEKPMAFSVQRI